MTSVVSYWLKEPHSLPRSRGKGHRPLFFNEGVCRMCGRLLSAADGSHLQRVIVRTSQGRDVPFTSTRVTRVEKTIARVDAGVGKLKLSFTGSGTVTWNTEPFLVKADVCLPCIAAVLTLDNNPRKMKARVRRLADKRSRQLCPLCSKLEATLVSVSSCWPFESFVTL